MWKGVQAYTNGCGTYARVNQRAGKVVGLLKPLPVARGRWERVGVDFITDVPTSSRGNDCIVTFVDHFSKRAHWMPCAKTIDAAEFAQLYLEAIIRLHGVPREIVSDRDARFTSDFWTEVNKKLQTKLLMSTAFHPQTDGLSEISNKQVTWYLQAFATHHQDQWDTMLPLAEYAYNTSTHSSTDRSPFELDLGYTPSIPLDFVAGRRQHDEMRSLDGAAFVERLQASLLDAQDRLREAQDSQTAEANKSRRPCTLQVGDLVMLNTKDLPITYASQDPSRRKLQYPWAGPYRIIMFRGPNAVELELPKDMSIHDTVNVSRLKKYIADPTREKPPPPPIRAVMDKHGTIQRSYVVEAIVSHKKAPGIKGGYKFQIKWEGYDDDDMTWEPAANLSNAKQILDDYKKQHGLGERKVKRKKKS